MLITGDYREPSMVGYLVYQMVEMTENFQWLILKTWNHWLAWDPLDCHLGGL